MKYTAVVFITLCCSISSAQYLYQDQPLGARIEHQPFFFVPNYMNPYGVDEFSTAVPGVVDHPLLNLAINPAALTSIGNDPLLYFDYRTNKEIERQYYYIMPMWDISVSREQNMIVPPYPYYPYNPSRLSIEPSFSSAILSKLFPESVPEWSIGVTYELISQSEPFYPLEVYDSYGPQPLAQRTVNDSKSYYGVDFVRNKGHLFAVYSAYRFNDESSVGIRFGGSLYDRNAERGPIISDYDYTASSSYSLIDDNRSQDHSLFDVTAGMKWDLTERIVLGATAGYLFGKFTQFEISENLYEYVSVNGTTTTYQSTSLNQINRKWENNGSGITAGLQTSIIFTPYSTVTGTFSYRHHLLHLTIRANDITGSTYSDQTQSPAYHNDYFSDDYRIGRGREYGYMNRSSLSYVLQSEKNIRLSIGVVHSSTKTLRNTNEGIVSSLRTAIQNDQQPYIVNRTKQSKNLLWDYDEITTETQIPLMLSLPLSTLFDLNFGINRRFISVEEKQYTLTQYHRIESYSNDSLVSVDENRRMMNTYPSRQMITNTMAVLFGLTIHPSDPIEIHIAGVPYTVNNDTHFQWMAGINVRP
jgi:hypothetical protein